MDKIYLIIDGKGNVTGWTLSLEFAEKVLAFDESIVRYDRSDDE